MRILILGRDGQLGSDLLRAAARDGIEAVGLGRSDLDLGQPGQIASALGRHDFSVLVNCAAFTAVDAAESEPGTAFAVNGYAVEALALECRRREAVLVQISTDYVFDGELDRPYRLDDLPAPINVYGASKLAGEALARRVWADGTLVVRTSSVFGPRGARGKNFVETMLRLGRERTSLQVVSDTRMAPTFSWDLATALLRLLATSPPAGTYHITNSGESTWHELAVAVMDQAGSGVRVDAVTSADYPTAARRPRYSVLDTRATDARIGELPPWRDALNRYLLERLKLQV